MKAPTLVCESNIWQVQPEAVLAFAEAFEKKTITTSRQATARNSRTFNNVIWPNVDSTPTTPTLKPSPVASGASTPETVTKRLAPSSSAAAPSKRQKVTQADSHGLHGGRDDLDDGDDLNDADDLNLGDPKAIGKY